MVIGQMKPDSSKRFLRMLLTPGKSLSQRAIHASFWAFALRIVDRLFQLARTIVLARVLSPNDFGLFGIALLAMAALETFSKTGFQQALIQKKGDIRPYLDTAWTVQVIRGLVLVLILFGIAPYAAAFFGEPAAVPLLRVLGLSMLFQGFTNIGVVYFLKELEFHKRFAYMFSGSLFNLCVAIPTALILRNAWALMAGHLAGSFVSFIVSYFIHPYRPRLRLDWGKGRELYDYGKYIFFQSIVLFLLTQGDDAFVGRFIGATALGFYQLAYRFSNMAATEITHVVSQVTFTVYSKLQDEQNKLKRAFTKTLKLTTFVTIPTASAVFILAPEFTKVFLGDKWMPMVPAMQVMCLFGAMRSVGATFGPVYRAIARPDIPLKINIIQLVFLATIIYPLTLHLELLGTAIAITLSMVLALCLTSRRIMDVLDIDFMSLLKPIFHSVSASIGMIIVILCLKFYILKAASYISILSLAAIGGGCYLGFMKVAGYNLWEAVRTLYNWRR
jgi:O-antigen/teichoic acid export membrane protein